MKKGMAIRTTTRPQNPRKIAEPASIFSFFVNAMVELLAFDYIQSEIFRKAKNSYGNNFILKFYDPFRSH